MKTTTESFLEQSRAYLFATDMRPQQGGHPDLTAQVDWPWPAPRSGNRRQAGSRKDRRRVRSTQAG